MTYVNLQKKPKPLLVVLLFCFIAGALAEEEPDQSGRFQKNTQAIVVMDEKTQALSGIETQIVSDSRYQAELTVIGKVLSFEPLLALRERYLIIRAELAGAKARQKQALLSLKRQQDLFRNGIVSKRSILEQEAQAATERVLVDAGEARLLKLNNEAHLVWGKELAALFLSEPTVKLTGFLSGRQKLLQIIMPANKYLADDVSTVAVDPNGIRDKAVPAVLLSRSAQVDNAVPGESYYFLADADSLRAGMKVSAWIPNEAAEAAGTGLTVPDSALIWFMNQLFVYVKTGEDRFARRSVKSFIKIPAGYLISGALSAGEAVVTTGGQTLLSEEFRGQIPDED